MSASPKDQPVKVVVNTDTYEKAPQLPSPVDTAEAKEEVKEADSSLSPLGKTALYIAAGRAYETRKAATERLFNDPYADAFCGAYGYAFLEGVAKELGYPAQVLANFVALRTRFLDDHTERAVRDGVRQVIILGVGGDSRAYRLALPADSFVYEIDMPDVLEHRNAVLARCKAASKATVRDVAADLSKRGELTKQLRAVGFDPASKSLLLVEGLLMYLSKPEVAALLDEMAELCAPGSIITGDMMNTHNVSSLMTNGLMNAWKKWGQWPSSGFDEPEQLLEEHGFERAEVHEFGSVGLDFPGYVSDAYKELILVKHPRSAGGPIARSWCFRAIRKQPVAQTANANGGS